MRLILLVGLLVALLVLLAVRLAVTRTRRQPPGFDVGQNPDAREN